MGGGQVEPGGAQGLEQAWVVAGEFPCIAGCGGKWRQGLDHALQDGNRPLGVAIRVEIAGLGQRGRRLRRQPARALDLEIAAADLLDAEALCGEGAGEGEERRQDDRGQGGPSGSPLGGELVAHSHCYSTTRTVPSRLSAMKMRARASTAMSSGARNSCALGRTGPMVAMGVANGS